MAGSTWYAFFQAHFAADAFDYFATVVPESEREQSFDESTPLPLDSPNAIENHSRTFEACMLRKGPWVAAVSGQHAPQAIESSTYCLGRQSRIELWHERARYCKTLEQSP